jgi:hypothetical protein
VSGSRRKGVAEQLHPDDEEQHRMTAMIGIGLSAARVTPSPGAWAAFRFSNLISHQVQDET